MIRITRGIEPDGLSDARTDGLDKIRTALANDPSALLMFDGYRVAARPLFERQGRKCCYCERELSFSYNDVEHYRPKARAERGPGHPSHGYWWLAWTWENLLFSCLICNRSFKRGQFPLASGSTALIPEQEPPGEEKPLLVDPADPSRDPLDSIEFQPVKVGGKTRWMPFGKDDRGSETIRVLGLDRDDLVTQYTRHVHHTLSSKLEDLREVLRSEEPRGIRHAWSRLVRCHLRRESPFAALSHDVLAFQFPPAIRARWNLELRRPPIDHPPAPGR